MPSAVSYEFTEKWIKRPDGHEIYTKVWYPFNTPIVATLAFFHGYGEHINRYEHVFSEFAKHGIKVGSFDQRGFGRTAYRSGWKGVTDGFDATVGDMNEVIEMIKVEGIPLFIMGHSMGGGLALRYCCMYPEGIKGVIASTYKPTSAGNEPNIFHRAFKSIIGQKLISNAVIMIPTLDYNILSRDAYQVQLYKEDPYIHCYASFRLLDEMFSGGDYVLNVGSKTFNLPILAVHGDHDQLTSYHATKKFIEMIPSTDKRFDTYEGAHHELHNDLVRDQVISSYVTWILEHI
ncbi:hypothetical protein HDV02_001122 [Globomyces sp. JEL0801]|nr:hypothetical protein HDV02_001122 [Globomyces sp. JEL0801]